MNLNQRWSDMNESQRKGLIIAIVAVIVIVLGLAGCLVPAAAGQRSAGYGHGRAEDG